MFDQAILYLHIGLSRERMNGKPNPAQQTEIPIDIQSENSSSAEKSEVEDLLFQLKSYGIRTATDLVNALKRPDAIKKTSLPRDKLNVIIDAMSDDEWLHIKEWRISASAISEPVTNPYEFYSDARKTVSEKESKLPAVTTAATAAP